MPDQSPGTYVIGLLIIVGAVVCGIILWLERVFGEARARHIRDLERRARRAEREADRLGREASECAAQELRECARQANDYARRARVTAAALRKELEQ